MKTFWVMLSVVLAASILVATPAAKAQNTYGNSSIDFDYDTNTVIGYCDTEMDYDVQVLYHSWVHCWLMDETNINGLAIAINQDPEGHLGYAATLVEAPGTPGIVYSVRSTNRAYVKYYDYYEDWLGNPYWDYYDDFNFGWFAGQNIGGILSIIYTGPGPSVTIHSEVFTVWVLLGDVVDIATMGSIPAVDMPDRGSCTFYDGANQYSGCHYNCVATTGEAALTNFRFHFWVLNQQCTNWACPRWVKVQKELWFPWADVGLANIYDSGPPGICHPS